MYKENLKDFAKIWFMDTVVSTGKVQDAAITTQKIADEAITKDKLEKDIQKRLTAGINDLLGLNLSDNPLERIRNDAGLMTVFRHVGCIGDSLASGEAVYKKADGTTGGKDLFEYSWGQYLARMTGNTYYNWSKGGLRCDTFLSSSLATECFDGNHKCEAYIIGLGQNENNRKYKIGTVEDINLGDYTQNPDTYYGNYGIQKIQEMQPKAKIFILTDPLKSVENAGYNSAVREIAGIFKSVYLVDLYTYGTALYNSGFLYQQKRGGHYNAVGYFICAMIISTYIDWIMKKNPENYDADNVFIDTIIVCSMTGFVILVTGTWTAGSSAASMMTSMAFEQALPGVGQFAVTICLTFFAFTTILGWCVYGERCAIYLFGDRAQMVFRLFYCLAVGVGSVLALDAVWLLADTCNALMALPNLTGVLLLSPVLFKIVRDEVARDRRFVV